MPQVIVYPTRNDMLGDLPKRWSSIAELGVFQGAFSDDILRICEPQELILIDIWAGSCVSGDKDGNNIVEIANMESVYQDLMAKYERDQRVHLIRDTTQSALATFDDGHFDFVYVDASHDGDDPLNDLRLAARKSKGLIGGHDYTPRFPDVMRAVNEFRFEEGWKLVALTQDGCPSYLLRRGHYE